ncbi:MAG: hypothetical protein FXF54_11990 [Kosmotoga sp.]|nr:MAG: hypothetical protein FXF54_11990 [Kosmotoga sp.]
MKNVLIGLLLLLVCTAGFSWTALEDYSNVEYVYYKTTGFDDGEEGIDEIIYGVNIEITKDGYLIKNETIYNMPPEAVLDSSVLFGQSAALSMYTMFDFVTLMVLAAVDFEEMVTTNLFMVGGTIKYEGQMTVQGKSRSYTGEKVVYYDEDKQIVKYWVINKNIPFPLLNVTLEEGEETIRTVLWDYKMR